MFGIRDSISKKLTALNMLVSGTAVLLACVAFFAYDLNSLRQNLLNDLSIQAQIIGYNSVSALIFDDQQSAEKTLSALQASSHIIYAGIYRPNGQFFDAYWRDSKDREQHLPLPFARRNAKFLGQRKAICGGPPDCFRR